MPTILLTDAMLRNLAPGEKLVEYWDVRVQGLCLRVPPSGFHSWSFRYRPKGAASRPRVPLGRYPKIGLALARSRAEALRVEVAGGGDPQEARTARREEDRKALSFNDLADQYIERYAKIHKKSWRNDELYLRVHVRLAWGGRKAKTIKRADAAALLDGIAKSSPVSANRVQATLSKLFNWSVESGLLDINPVARMKKRAREVAKDRTLAPDEIRVLWRVFKEERGSVVAALRFLLLTGLRPGETAGAAIAELHDIDDGARARLEIPSTRMKGGKSHILPLAPIALAIVRGQLEQVRFGQSYIFPSAFAARGPTARNSLSQALRRIIAGLRPSGGDEDAVTRLKANPPTPHDFRRTVASGLSALGVGREDRLAVLAHSIGDVHAVHYDKHDRFREKLAALALWEKHLAVIVEPQAAAPGNVVDINDPWRPASKIHGKTSP
jgi:integrase